MNEDESQDWEEKNYDTIKKKTNCKKSIILSEWRPWVLRIDLGRIKIIETENIFEYGI